MSNIDITTQVNKEVFGYDEDHTNVNKFIRAVILELRQPDGTYKEYIVTNDNFGTDEEKACFMEGKKAAGLHPGQIVFSGLQFEASFGDGRYIDANGAVKFFKDLPIEKFE